MRNYELYHYGMPRRSGRYPWGSGERPYQGSGQQSISRTPKEKERVLQSGTAKEVLSWKGELTNAELQRAVTRLNLEANLNSMTKKELDVANSVLDTVMKDIKTGTQWALTGIAAYSTIARIYNATPQGRLHPLPALPPLH